MFVVFVFCVEIEEYLKIKGVFIIYGKGRLANVRGRGGGQAKFYSLIEDRGSERLYSGEEGRGWGQEKFDGLYPSLSWVLNICKNCMTFGNRKEFYKFNVIAMSP